MENQIDPHLAKDGGFLLVRKDRCKCGGKRRKGQGYCADCHAAYMRNWRRNNDLNPTQRAKSNCRRYANVYQERGKLIPKNCEKCGNPEVQKHHRDYSKPLEVSWLCKECHLEEHRNL